MKRVRRPPAPKPEIVEYRINRQIRAREVRLIDHTNTNRGVVPFFDALKIAEDAELDLVEVAPNSDPPVCRILDYGKFVYEQTKKEREARKHQKKIEIKTIRLTPRTGDYHIDIGVRTARRWLAEGKKVKFMVKFKSREISYPEIGQKALQDIAEELKDVAIVEQQPTLEGWRMTLTLSPEVAAAKPDGKANAGPKPAAVTVKTAETAEEAVIAEPDGVKEAVLVTEAIVETEATEKAAVAEQVASS